MNDDLTRAETAVMFSLHDRRWTSLAVLPPDAVRSLVGRGLVEVSTWAEWVRLTNAGDAMFDVEGVS